MPRSITLYEIQSVNANNSLKSGPRRRYYETNIIFIRISESERVGAGGAPKALNPRKRLLQ